MSSTAKQSMARLLWASVVVTALDMPWLNASLPVDLRADLLLGAMTAEEKVAQTLSAHVSEDYSELLANFGAVGFGVCCLPERGAPPNATRASVVAWRDGLQRALMGGSRLRIPLSFRAELLHSGAAPGSVVFPVPAALGATWNRSLARAVAAASAVEARRGGIDLGFGPVLQLATDARWGRFDEAYSEDPLLVTELALAATVGFQGEPPPPPPPPDQAGAGAGGAVATGTYIRNASTQLPMQAKHFAFYGAIPHDTLAVDRSLATLHDDYLRPWRAFVGPRGGGRSVMASHPPVNRVPAVANAWLLSETLRQAWAPHGENVTVASDNGDVRCLADGWKVAPDHAAAAALAVVAGLDQELNTGVDTSTYGFYSLAQRSRNDSAVAAALDRAARNCLRIKFAAGLFERPLTGSGSGGGTAVATAAAAPAQPPQYVALAREAATQGSVLLLNGNSGGNGTLPLDLAALALRRGEAGAGAGLQVAVVGPNGDGADARLAQVGGYAPHDPVTAASVVTVAAAMRAEVAALAGGGAVRVAQGAYWCNTSEARDAAAVAEALAAARASHLALVVVGDSGGKDQCDTCGEGKDRLSLDLPGSQLRLLQALLDGIDPAATTLVVLLVHGRPATFGGGAEGVGNNELLRHPNLGALVAAWRPGQQGGPALLDLLTGRAPFSGKLAQAWPRTVGLINSAAHPWYGLPLRGGPALTRDAYSLGPSKTALFPFAHGIVPGAAFAFSGMVVRCGSGVAAVQVAAGAAAGLPPPLAECAKQGNATVEFVVRHSGTAPRRSAVVAQLYYSPPIAPLGVMRYARRLLGFEKAWLQPGEARTLTLQFDVADGLGRYDERLGRFVVDGGVHGLYVGDCNINGVLDDDTGCEQLNSTITIAAN
jgi:beta-glucosidase